MGRKLVLELPEPPSTNKMLRQHYRDRTRQRNLLEGLIRGQKPRGWKPMQRFRVDAELRLFGLRDPLELWMSAKEPMDASILAGVIEDDGPEHCVPGEIVQCVNRGDRGLTLIFTELPPRRGKKQRG